MKLSIKLSVSLKGICRLAVGVRRIDPPDTATCRYFTASASSISFCPSGTSLANLA
jgi:hypothetical protein